MLRPLRHLFSPHGFRGPVLTLLSGVTVALGLSYLAQFALTRLYTPADFGVADYFVMIMSVLMTCTSLRYEDAVMLPKDDEEAASILGLAFAVTLVFAAAATGLAIWRVEVAAWLRVPEVAPWLGLIPPTLVLMRAARLSELWLTRRQRFRVVSAGQITNTGTMVAVRLSAGAPSWNAGPGGLIGGFVLAQVASLALYGGAVLRRRAGRLRRLRAAVRPRTLRRLAGRYRRFALFSTPSALLHALVARLPHVLLPWFFGVSVLGLYGRAFTALYVPLNLIGGAVAQVFFIRAAEAHRAGTLATLTAGVHARLVMIGLFPALALVVAGPDVFSFAFGEAWRPAGVYARYIAPWLFLTAVSSPLTRLFDVLERQRLDLGASLVLFAVQTAALVMGGLQGHVELTLLLLGLAGTLTRGLLAALLLRMAAVPARDAIRPYGRYALFALPALVLLAAVQPAGRPWLTTLALAGGGALYAGLVLWRDRLFAAAPEEPRGRPS